MLRLGDRGTCMAEIVFAAGARHAPGLVGLDATGIRLVPVLQNCTVPPYPDQRRCYAIGQALGNFIREDLPGDLRVALFGSGGLSHEPGGARYFHIDEEFDRWFLDLCAR